MELSMKKVLITGGTSGIGRALAEALVSGGAEVFVCGRRPERVARVQSELGVRALACDLSSPEEVRRLAATARSEMAGLDVLVNNAGIQQSLDLSEGISADELNRELFVNFVAPVLLTNELLSPLLSSPQAAIVNVTSGLALVPTPRVPVYSASKAALASYTRSLRWSLQDAKVLVTEVLPPVVQTEMNNGRTKNAMKPREIATRILDALSRDRERLVVGQVRALEWMVRLFPSWAESVVSRV
jgi:short-subunit dehydrogenase involved in D-alanine esterification of teichoic acids